VSARGVGTNAASTNHTTIWEKKGSSKGEETSKTEEGASVGGNSGETQRKENQTKAKKKTTNEGKRKRREKGEEAVKTKWKLP